MARKPSFMGSKCTKDCSGHQAGWDYANSGGSKPNPASPSFNNGMAIANGTFVSPRRGRPRKAK